jgi:CelD/BcsL family acetyltransferase involved in cellulose biosynthesis
LITGTDAARRLSREHGSTTISTELRLGARAFEALEAEWKELFETSGTQNPFLCWEWISTWVRHFCGDRLRTVVVYENGRAIAVAPFHLNKYLIGPGIYAHALQLLGPKEVQHLFEIREILIRPGHEDVALAAVLDRVNEMSGWDWFELSANGDGLARLRALIDERSPDRNVRWEPTSYIPVMSLESNWDSQRRFLKRNIKESIRHCYNSLRREGLEHLYTPDGGPTAERASERLVDLHRRRSLVIQRRWHRDHFVDDPVRAFELDVLNRMHSAGRLRFAEISIGGKVVAARACMETHRSLYLYYSGFDPAWWKYSVMTLAVTEVIKDAIARGLSTVNFSPGVDESKSRWGPELISMGVIVLIRATALSRARYAMLSTRKRIRQPLHRRLDMVLGVIRQPAATFLSRIELPGRGGEASPQPSADDRIVR